MANFRTVGTDFSEGLRTPHYTNGRLLTAEDLQQEQQYQIERHAHLGQAAGYGIVEGFHVSTAANSTALSVTAGLGLNRQGDVVHLAAEAVTLPVQLVTNDKTAVRRSARFAFCETSTDEQPASVATGAYLLTVVPLAQMEGSVPRRSCDGAGTSACANQWAVDGVEFKIIRLVDYKPPKGSKNGRNRNLLAHYFYGSDELLKLMRDPLQFPANYTGFDRLPTADFNECDLPLAAFYWSKNKIEFVDEWAARRRVTRPYSTVSWAANLSDQRAAEGQARYHQFQRHITDLQLAFGERTNTLRAADNFAYLPPVGILPINPFELIVADVFETHVTERQIGLIRELGLSLHEVLDRVRAGVLGSLGSKNAFNLERFFGDHLSSHYQVVHEDYIHDRLHQSWVQSPILLPPPPTKESEAGFFELYLADEADPVLVGKDNFETMILSMHEKFGGSVFTHQAVEVEAQAARAETMVNKNKTFRPPKEIFESDRVNEEIEAEPLIDILVMDELLDPYREQLVKEMNGRIDDAISLLIGDVTLFTGDNRYKYVNNAIANAFVLNQFLWEAANYGYVAVNGLLQLIETTTSPVFYVVFVRHHPPVEQKRLRL